MGNLSFVVAFLCLVTRFGQFSSTEEFEPFRMAKINVVWSKAQRSLDGKVLSDLYADLLLQDKKEKELKKRKFDGRDKDGLYEAEVRDSFMDILLKYGLTHHFPQETVSTESGKRNVDIRDEKLRKILKSARKEGFTDEEMQILKEEMSHYQTKLDLYNLLKEEYETLDGRVDNSLENIDEQEEVWKELSQKKKDMKKYYKEFREGVNRLETKIADKDNVAGKFEDDRVYHLWALAQKSGMTEEELENYRKELTHFETRIRKAEYLRDQVEQSKRKLATGETVDETQHQELRAHAEKVQRKVDKYHTELKEKVHRRLDEL